MTNQELQQSIPDALDKNPIWLVWTLGTSGLTTLRVIATSQPAANFYRKRLKDDPKVVLVQVEKTVTNHLYGEIER